MEIHQIEAWALDLIERVEKGQPIEDSRVELKANWPDAKRAARRIAGHGNAARGAPILWLIGVDEQKRSVTGAKYMDVAKWWAAVQGQFDGLAPDLIDLNVPTRGVAVVALYMEPTRVPFVVRNPMHGKEKGDPAELEVPWREGTAIRTARREDLVRILSPLQALPSFEFRDGNLAAIPHTRNGEKTENLVWILYLGLYVVPQGREVVIPFHQCRVEVQTPKPWPRRLHMLNISLREPTKYVRGAVGFSVLDTESASLTIHSTDDEAIIQGPGRLTLHAAAQTGLKEGLPRGKPVWVVAELRPVEADFPAVIEVTLPPVAPQREEVARWQVYRKL
jgi:hypothetical protein